MLANVFKNKRYVGMMYVDFPFTKKAYKLLPFEGFTFFKVDERKWI